MANISSDKLGRNYRLEVSTINSKINPKTGAVEPVQSYTLTFTLPLTVEFDVKRNYLTSANDCSIRILNLSPETRNLIRKDVTDWDLTRFVKLYGGYGNDVSYNSLSLIFSGQISECWSVREGVDFITEIQCMDAGFAFQQAQFDQSMQGGVTKQQLITEMINSLIKFDVAPGFISEFEDNNTRGNTYLGNTIEQINQIAQGCFFIDNGIANCLNTNDCFNGQIGLIDSNSGLLNTPIRQQTLIHFDMLFEPRLVVGQYILLHSSTDVNFNGAYKVMSVGHRGTISPVVCGEVVTTVGLQGAPYGQNFRILD